VVDLITQFGSYFWQVFTFWACWQICDWVLSRLKIKLRKPWILSKSEDGGCESEAPGIQLSQADSEDQETATAK
tara:strand:- start:181 stop:402 length:222 start_codon:yes stop_codon:yes gene_type:complete